MFGRKKINAIPADQVLPQLHEIVKCDLAVSKVMGWYTEEPNIEELATGRDRVRLEAAKEIVHAVYNNPNMEISDLILDGQFSQDTQLILLESIGLGWIADKLIGKTEEQAAEFLEKSGITQNLPDDVEKEITPILNWKFGYLKQLIEDAPLFIGGDLSDPIIQDHVADVVSNMLDPLKQKERSDELHGKNFKGAVQKVRMAAYDLILARAGGELLDMDMNDDGTSTFTPSGAPDHRKINRADVELEQALKKARAFKVRMPKPFHEAMDTALKELTAMAHIARADAVLTREQALEASKGEGQEGGWFRWN